MSLPQKKYKILVVDDDRELLELVQEILTNSGYKVVTATDGVDGTFKYNNEAFDLIISDIKMPKKDGIKFIQHIQHSESQKAIKLGSKYRPLPLILISASIEEYRVEIDLLTNIECINKPFSPKDLLSKMSRLLEPAQDQGSGSALLFKKGEFIIKEGDSGSDVYFLKRGRLSVSKKSDNGQDVEVCVVGPGEIVGEMGFLLNQKRTATVSSLEDSELISIPKEKIEAVISAQPKWFKVFFETIAGRLEQTTNLLVKEKSKY